MSVWDWKERGYMNAMLFVVGVFILEFLWIWIVEGLEL